MCWPNLSVLKMGFLVAATVPVVLFCDALRDEEVGVFAAAIACVLTFVSLSDTARGMVPCFSMEKGQ